MSSAQAIARLNDDLRSAITRPAIMAGKGTLMITIGIQSLEIDTVGRILLAIQDFTSFTGDNDPHGEHDFGKVTVAGHDVFWKIDYYDKNLEFASEDPSDPRKTRRVLTVMLAEEY